MGAPTMQSSVDRLQMPANLREVQRCEQCGAYLIATPLLECLHCGDLLPLRCFSYRKGRYYYAECVDLDLISRGDSDEEAIGRLQEQMFGYVQTVIDGGSAKGLIPRRAPLTSWIRYYCQTAVARIVSLFLRRHSTTIHPHYPGVTRLTHC